MQPKVSIIVPIYKAEEYLHHCVNSILAQTFADFELLLVNDGSPDKSGEICNEYAKKDSRVRVCHKEYGGVSSARQCGLDHARGEYTIHADPDDWVEANMLEALYSKAKEDDSDMVLCDYYICKKGKKCYVSQTPSSIEHDSLLRQYLGQELVDLFAEINDRYVATVKNKRILCFYLSNFNKGSTACSFLIRMYESYKQFENGFNAMMRKLARRYGKVKHRD